jgi:ACS family tartrate transporter-like MFS transporter
LWTALCNPRVLGLAVVLFGTGFAGFGVGLWLALIVQGMGFSNVETGFVVALPYLAAVCAMFVWGRSSDVSGERIWHVAGPAIIASASLIAASFTHSEFILLAAISVRVVCIGAFKAW